MPSDSLFTVRLGGCAEAARELNESRRCVMDVQSILLEASDHLRQLRVVQRTLDLHPVTPSPPLASPPRASPHPLHRPRMKDDEAVRPVKIALPMLYSDATGDVALAVQESWATMECTPRSSPSTRTFTPVSTMQRLAHPVVAGLPVSVVATNALNFVAAWRREDSNSAGQEEVVHDCLQVRYDTEQEEGSRSRLRHLLLTVSEQMDRFAIMGEYDKFAVFCIDHEPVWRQAARQLQKENDARFNSTENIYARFVMEETALSEKMKMYQEATDYVLSQRFAEWEMRRAAQKTAVERRRRQSASHVVPVPSEPRQRAIAASTAAPATPPPERHGAAAGAFGHSPPPPVPHRPADTPDRHSGRSKDRAAPPPSKPVEPLSSVEVDPYRERWRSIVGYLSGGERGKPATHAAPAAEARHQSSPASALPPAARAEAHRAALPPAVRDGRFTGAPDASSMESEEDRYRRARHPNRHDGSGTRDDTAVVPKLKDEVRKKEARSADGASPPPLSKRDAEKEEKRRRELEKEEKRRRESGKEDKRRRDAEKENKREREARVNGHAHQHHQAEGKVRS